MECNSTLETHYQSYDRQQCFVAHSIGAEWNEDLKSACTATLPKFNLEPWYAADRFDPTQTLRDKVVELIANSRYGIYDISSWQDKQGNRQLPRNVFIELGIAIVLNRPTLLLRHSSNNNLQLPTCLEGIETVEFAGDYTLKKELENRIPQWLEVPPDRDWLDRFCLFGNRVCSHREQHPHSQQWGRQTLHCHISDGLDKNHPNYCQSACDEIRGAFKDIFSRYNDLEFSYLDDRSIVDGYQFLLCSHCQTVRSTPLAIYRISPTTSAETFISIGIGIALEKLFAYKIPKILLVRQEQDLPSLLRGYEAVEVVNISDIKQKFKGFLPKVIQTVRETNWQPRPLPFIEAKIGPEDRSDPSETKSLDESIDKTTLEADLGFSQLLDQNCDSDESMTPSVSVGANGEELSLRVYPYGIGRDELEQVIEVLNLPIVLTKDMGSADAVLALRTHIKNHAKLRQISKVRQVPIYSVKSGTIPQITRTLRRMLHMDDPGIPEEADLRLFAQDGSEDEVEALEEVRLAVEQIVIPKSQAVELLPRSSTVRKMQHGLVEHYHLKSASFGEEPNRRLRIFPA